MLSSHKKYISIGFSALYLALFVVGLNILKSSESADAILSPWQTIAPSFIYIFWLATLVLGGILAFAKLRTRFMLFLLALHGFLLYSYLPLTHPLIYGADGWRHLGDVTRILNGVGWREVSWSSEGTSWLNQIGLVAYSGFWGLIALLSKFSGLELVSILRWLQPVIASGLLPIIGFWMGKSIGLTRRMSLLAAWLMFFPFALQAVGAFTLPVSLWFIFFATGFVFLVRQFNNELPNRKFILGIFVFLCFGYSLYPMLFAVAWGLAEVLRFQSSRGLRWYVGLVAAALAGIVLPTVELFSAGSRLLPIGNYVSATTQLVGNITGYYLANGPRPHDIATGNIFFNQIPSYAFVPNLFTTWRYWIVIFSCLFIVGVAFGAYRLYRYGSVAPQLVSVFGVAAIVSYVVGRYFVIGGQFATRRMDAVIAFVCIYLFLSAKERAIEKLEKHGKSIVPLAAVFVVVFSIATATSYSLGPDARTVSVEQYMAMQEINKEEVGIDSHCVIADTYSLLVLEALSGERIVGGGFPINSDFSQPDLDAIRANLDSFGASSFKDINYALSTTGAKRCWYVTDNGFVGVVEGHK